MKFCISITNKCLSKQQHKHKKCEKQMATGREIRAEVPKEVLVCSELS